MEQQPPPAAKFEDENSYSYVTGGECRTAIHTGQDFLLATVLLVWSFRKPGAFKAWCISTTKHFLGLGMWKTRHFSQKEHGTQWATRLLSAAFAALTVVTGVTVCILNGHYAGAATVSVSATACVSWRVHAARMRQLGFIDKADANTWTATGVVLQKLDFLWKVVNTNETTCKQPFTNATLIIFAYNIVLGTTALYLVLGNTGAVIVWANCFWGFLSLWLLIHGGLLAGAFDKICEVAFNPIFDGLMKAAVAGYEKVDAVDEAIRIGTRHVDDAEREGGVIPVLIDVLRDDVNAVLRAKSLPLVPASLVTASAIMGRLNLTRHGASASYENARCAVVSYLTGIEDGRIVFRNPPTGRLADIAACYKGKLANDAKDEELGGIAHQFTAKQNFLRRYLGKRVGGGAGGTYTRQGGLKDEETLVMVVQTNACYEDGFKKGESTCATDQTGPSGLIKIEIGRDAECTGRFLKGRPAMRSQLAGVYAFTRFMMWKKFAENPTDADALGALDINTYTVQRYLNEFFREPHRWEVHASRNSQGLAMGIGMRFWYKCPGDKTWTLVSRGKDSKYWQFFKDVTDSDLDRAIPYKELTINGAPDGPKFAPIWMERLALDDKYADDTWTESRDATRATRLATARAVVAAWNNDKTLPVPPFSVALNDGSGKRRCSCVAFSSELAANGKKNTDDTDEYGPVADAVAAAGGLVVSLTRDSNGLVRDDLDLVLAGRGVKFRQKTGKVKSLKLDCRIVSVNWRYSEWDAESHPGTVGSLFGRRGAAATGSLARSRPTRGASRVAAPAAATPAAPAESVAELAAAPCFVWDALVAGQPVLDDVAKPFREHYACFERNRTDPNATRYRSNIPTPWEKFHEEHGEFYPPDYNQPPGGFSPKGPPTASYSA